MAAAAISEGKRRSRSEGESDRAESEHATSPAPSSRSSTKQQIRHRASIACASCRERRIRCVVGEGESECTQCRRTGATCIIKDDDERRRPISKAYMSSLSNRINLLEEMLKERGVVPPPAVHPPKTRQEAQSRQHNEQHQAQGSSGRSDSSEPGLAPPRVNQPPTPPGSGDEDIVMVEAEPPKSVPASGQPTFTRLIDPLLLQDAGPKQETGTRHLLCTRGSYVFDQAVGRIRYFGPTANSHVHAKPSSGFATPEQHEGTHRAELFISSLATSTYDHLMRCFWDTYNSWQQVVDESAFEAGRTTQDPRFYSPFLHLAMLGIGYRFADWDREDVKVVALGNRESTLHREAKAVVEAELDRPGGMSSVQALLLLADLEAGVGRDATGWMYSGMANRLAFDIGLHVNSNGDVISELERQTRCQVMAACVMFDRKWALLLGRPVAIKMQDIRVDMLPRVTGKAPASNIGTVATHSAINRQMFELLELAGKVADFQNSTYGPAHLFTSKAAEDRAYLHFIGLERLFHNWYRRLPENLTWKPVNIKSAHMGFFMLHQQFHVCMILLHRPWAKYGPMTLDGAVTARYPSPESPGREDGTGLPSWMAPLQHHDNRASMSRSMCTQHAIRIARIFWHHRQRFDGKRVVLTATQHAGTAALALMAALAHKSAELDHHSNLRYLQVLSSAIYDMSHLYQPAARMYQLLKTMLVEIRAEMVKSGGFDVSTLVGRYQGGNSSLVFGSNNWATGADSALSSADRRETIQEEDRATKRRRLSSLSSLDFTSFTPVFLNNTQQACPTPSVSTQSVDGSNSITEQTASEPGTFDMDFFHASFVDFINTGGDGPGSQDWTPGADSTAPILFPTPSGDLSCMSSGMAAAAAQTAPPPVTPPPAAAAAAAAPSPAAAAADDDTSADKTIEDWLAEPSKATAPEALHHSVQQATGFSTHLTDPTRHHGSGNGNLSHAAADGTPICRDPYVLSLETELGLGFGLGPEPSSSNANNTADGDVTGSGNGGNSGMEISSLDAIDAIDWFAAVSPAATSQTQAQAQTQGQGQGQGQGQTQGQPPSGSSTGVSVTGGEIETKSTTPAAAAVAPPMTPVTLDELVQSVEEAVGSARARARAARAAASASAAASGSASVGGSTSAPAAGVGGSGAGCGGGGVGELQSQSPGLRNRELDFLAL